MPPALPFMSLIFMLDSLFITNFFCIKYWRVKADDPADHSLPYINESAEEEAPDDGVISKTSFARKLRHAWMTVTDPNKLVHEQKAEAKKSRMLRCTGCVKTILLGAVHREPNSEGKFADWRGIPGRKGFISTALFDEYEGFLIFAGSPILEFFRLIGLDFRRLFLNPFYNYI